MKKAKSFETDYFIKENATIKHKFDEEQKKKNKKTDDEKLKALHFMKCPKCGHDLATKRLSYVDVDQCLNCGVVVLEPDNIDRFITEEQSLLKSLIDFFK